MGVGVARLYLGFFGSLRAEVRHAQFAAEDIVSTKPELGLGLGGEPVADFDQFGDQIIEGRMVPDLDEFLDSSAHSDPPRPTGAK